MVHSADDAIGLCSILNPGMHDILNFPLNWLGKTFKSSMCGESQDILRFSIQSLCLFA